MQSRPRRRHGPIGGFAVCAALLIATVAWLSFYNGTQSSIEESPHEATASPDEGARYGTISMRVGGGKGCRQVKFDNSSGTIQEGPVTPCSDDTPFLESSEARMKKLRGSFSKR
jgi:hypothetical protein